MKHFFNRLFNRKNGIKSVYALLAAVGFLIVAVLNIVMGALADRYPLAIDLTGTKLFELSGDTVQFIQSLEEAALYIGVTPHALAQYEAGLRVPRDEVKLRLSRYYGLSLEQLFFDPQVHVS